MRKQEKRYKLYDSCGYLCKITISELQYLFTGPELKTIEEINNYLISNSTGYYIKMEG